MDSFRKCSATAVVLPEGVQVPAEYLLSRENDWGIAIPQSFLVRLRIWAANRAGEFRFPTQVSVESASESGFQAPNRFKAVLSAEFAMENKKEGEGIAIPLSFQARHREKSDGSPIPRG